jgi:hypothetical protein
MPRVAASIPPSGGIVNMSAGDELSVGDDDLSVGDGGPEVIRRCKDDDLRDMRSAARVFP